MEIIFNEEAAKLRKQEVEATYVSRARDDEKSTESACAILSGEIIVVLFIWILVESIIYSGSNQPRYFALLAAFGVAALFLFVLVFFSHTTDRSEDSILSTMPFGCYDIGVRYYIAIQDKEVYRVDIKEDNGVNSYRLNVTLKTPTIHFLMWIWGVSRPLRKLDWNNPFSTLTKASSLRLQRKNASCCEMVDM